MGPGFLGNWIEEESSFLFFSAPARELVQGVIEKDETLRLIEEFYFTYEEWQGGKIKPMRVSGLLIAPPWENIEEGNEEKKILLDPGVVFGTSLHPTTRDCLEALVEISAETHYHRVLDLGTGTGILAIAARRLGAENILAVDINPLAVKTALLNVRLNNAENRITVKKGLAEDFIDHRFDLLMANLHYDTILKLITARGFLEKRYFILSGLMRSQARDIRLKLARFPVELFSVRSRDMVWHTISGKVKR